MQKPIGRLALAAACLSVCAFAEPGSSVATDKENHKPNIIFILADDLSYGDLSCFGQKQFATPNIDRLAAEGRVFANAYAGGPWCSPSRTALLTGRNGAHFAPPSKDRFNPTVAEMLKTAGYATCALGKWHMWEGGFDSWTAYGKTHEAATPQNQLGADAMASRL